MVFALRLVLALVGGVIAHELGVRFLARPSFLPTPTASW